MYSESSVALRVQQEHSHWDATSMETNALVFGQQGHVSGRVTTLVCPPSGWVSGV